VRYYKGHIALSDARDVPILLHVRNARAICFDQLCDLLSLEIITERPRSLRWRLARLEKAGLVTRLQGHAQMQHEEYGRPPMVGRAQVIHVTEDFINNMRGNEVVEPGRGICDFCSSDTPAVTTYEARDFVMQTGQLSSGGWAACPSCSRSVESRDMERLAKRMVETSGISSGRSWEVARRQVQDFFLHKIEYAHVPVTSLHMPDGKPPRGEQ
jgi:hypothetical protein